MATLDVIRRGTPDPTQDLWPRLRARLAGEDERVRVEIPALGWLGAAALAAAVATVWLMPDPVHLLAVSGLL